MQIDRVFAIFQTIHERNACVERNVADEHPVWLRTCYDPALEERYQELRDECEAYEPYSVDDADVFEDASLYADLPVTEVQDISGSDQRVGGVQALLLRAPGLTDVDMFYTVEDAQRAADLDNEDEDDLDELSPEQLAVELVSKKAKWLIYVVDEEVLRDDRGLVKIMWMDQHGQCVWENKIEPNVMASFRGALSGGGTMSMHIESHTVEGEQGEEARWVSGAVFRF
jgi:hypothetical protein